MNIADELQKLAELRDKGVLSDAEFAAAKAKLLAPPPTGVATAAQGSTRTAQVTEEKKTATIINKGINWGVFSHDYYATIRVRDSHLVNVNIMHGIYSSKVSVTVDGKQIGNVLKGAKHGNAFKEWFFTVEGVICLISADVKEGVTKLEMRAGGPPAVRLDGSPMPNDWWHP